MNSITFVVDKLTPPSAPMHHHPPNQPQSSSSASSTLPDSGYFSIYSSDHDDSGLERPINNLLRQRQTEKSLEPNLFDPQFHLADRNIPSRNSITRRLMGIFS